MGDIRSADRSAPRDGHRVIVLDASAWVDVLVGGSSAQAFDDAIVVPPHFDAEVIGPLRGLVQRGTLPLAKAERAVDRHLRAPFDRNFDPDDIQPAWRWREFMSFTDAWYAVLARRLRVTWVTANPRAAATAGLLGVEVEII
ncbi:MAG: type II toxin-antitoxin system VapC family toxin [Ornithinimicrobium sp.]